LLNSKFKNLRSLSVGTEEFKMCKIKEVEEWKQNAKFQLCAGKWKNPSFSAHCAPVTKNKGGLI
jgi:hypothetical protein